MVPQPSGSTPDPAPWAHSVCATTCAPPLGCMNPNCPNGARRPSGPAIPSIAGLSDDERQSLATFTDGTYTCASAERCSGYDDNKPGHMHENLFDAVQTILADRLDAVERRLWDNLADQDCALEALRIVRDMR